MVEAKEDELVVLKKVITLAVEKIGKQEVRVKELSALVRSLTVRVDEAHSSILFFLNEDVPDVPPELN